MHGVRRARSYGARHPPAYIRTCKMETPTNTCLSLRWLLLVVVLALAGSLCPRVGKKRPSNPRGCPREQRRDPTRSPLLGGRRPLPGSVRHSGGGGGGGAGRGRAGWRNASRAWQRMGDTRLNVVRTLGWVVYMIRTCIYVYDTVPWCSFRWTLIRRCSCRDRTMRIPGYCLQYGTITRR